MASKRKLRILLSSNAPWAPSGYANQTRDLAYRWLNDGWNVALSAFYGLEGGVVEIDGLRCYPKITHPYGSDAMMYHARDWKADIVIPFQDLWVLDPNHLRQMRYMPYVPIDYDPVPDQVVQRLQRAYRIVTYSKFGQEAIKKAGFHSSMIPHGVDTNRFKPKDKKEMRRKFGLPEDLFLFGMVSANKDNPPRKEFQRVMDAYAMFKKNHPKSGIYMHTLFDQPSGFPIMQYAKVLGIVENIYRLPAYQVMFKMNHAVIADLMSAFDVLLSPSASEGFGMPIIESQAAGVPVIVNNFTAMPELVIPEKTGLITEVGYKRYVNLLSFWGNPSVESLYANMENIYKMNRVKMGQQARSHAVKNYDIDMICKTMWNPLFESIEEDLYKE